MSCPKCTGFVTVAKDDYGDAYSKCINCGWQGTDMAEVDREKAPVEVERCKGRQGRGRCTRKADPDRFGFCRFHGGKDPQHTVTPYADPAKGEPSHQAQQVAPTQNGRTMVSPKLLELLDREIEVFATQLDEIVAKIETLKRAKEILAKT